MGVGMVVLAEAVSASWAKAVEQTASDDGTLVGGGGGWTERYIEG